MADPTEPPRLSPTLRCRDAEAMIRWLTGPVGFREHMVHRSEGVVAHAELSLGSSILMLGQMRDDAYGALVGGPGGRRTDALYLAVPDPDALHDRLRDVGATIESGLQDKPYGSRELLCRDPEGNLWCFGTYWPKAGGAA